MLTKGTMGCLTVVRTSLATATLMLCFMSCAAVSSVNIVTTNTANHHHHHSDHHKHTSVGIHRDHQDDHQDHDHEELHHHAPKNIHEDDQEDHDEYQLEISQDDNHDHDKKENHNSNHHSPESKHGDNQEDHHSKHNIQYPESSQEDLKDHDHKKHHHSNHHHHHTPDSFHEDDSDDASFLSRLGTIPSATWLASFSSIGVISVVGLMTVGIIPLLKGPHQETALQLLVSLAVGTLVGDALIHLLPHALNTDHGDTSAVWKGFVATLTILAFYVMDRVLEGLGQGHSHGLPDGDHSDHSSTDVETVSTRTSRDSSPINKAKSISSLYSLYEREHSYQSLASNSGGVCSMPVSSLMVIIGDAIHNFADGLAVGAAFSMSLAAGFSTSIAVLCHELPHEVGDFALLLHSGMSAKVAIMYNCVSSIFAFIGLVAGLLLGSHEGFSSWLLAATVGVFLYVALVSMLTELKGGDWKNSALNTFGMLCGAVLLLFIGLYEHDLILMFEQEHVH